MRRQIDVAYAWFAMAAAQGDTKAAAARQDAWGRMTRNERMRAKKKLAEIKERLAKK